MGKVGVLGLRSLRWTGGLEEEAEERRRMEGAEAAAERRGGGHRAAPRAAGVGGPDERGEGGEAHEDVEQDVEAEGGGGGRARFLLAFRRWRIGRRSFARHGVAAEKQKCLSESPNRRKL